MSSALPALIIAMVLRAAASAQDAEAVDAEARRVAAWRAAVERVNERIRSSSISWLDGPLGVNTLVRMSPDGGRLVAWAQDGSAWLWDAWTGEPIGLLGMFGMGETSMQDAVDLGWPKLAFSADGERILLHETLAGFAGLWDGRSAEFLGYLEVGQEVVRAVSFSSDGRRVAVATEAGLVRFYDAETAFALEAQTLEARAVDALSFSPDGSRLLAVTSDFRGKLWDTRTGALLGDLGSDDLPLCNAVFSADGSRVLGTSKDAIALVFTAQPLAGQSLQPLVVRAPEGKFWAAVDWGTGRHLVPGTEVQSQAMPVYPHGNRLIVFEPGPAILLWDPSSNRVVAPLEGADIGIRANSWIGFSPDGDRLLTIGNRRARLWNAGTGERIADLEFAANHAAFSSSGRYVATASSSLQIPRPGASVYDVATGRYVGGLDLGGGTSFGLHFSANDRLAGTSAFGWSAVWDATREPLVLGAHALQVAEEGLDSGFAKWSPSGTHLLTPTWGRREWFDDRLWNARTGAAGPDLPAGAFSGGGFVAEGELITVRPAGTTTVPWVVPDGPAARAGVLVGDRIVKIGGRDMSIHDSVAIASAEAPAKTTIVVLRDGQELELPLEFPQDPTDVANSERRLGVGDSSDVRIEFRDAETGAVRRSILLEDVRIRYLHQASLNRDATRLLVRQGPTAALFDLTNGQPLERWRIEQNRRSTMYDMVQHLVAMSPGGDVCAAVQSGGASLWTEAADEAQEFLPGAVLDLEFSPDGWSLAGAGADGSVVVWDLAETKVRNRLEGHRGEVRFVAFDGSSQRIVSAGADGTGRIWDLSGKREPLVLAGHAGLPNRPSFSPDGSRVVTTADDATARLWDASTGAVIAVLEGHVGPIIHASFSPDGTRLLTQACDGSSRIWNGADGRLLATRVEYVDGWVMFEPGGSFIAGGRGAEHAQMVVNGRRYPLSSYSAIYESPAKVAESLAGKPVRAPAFVPQAPELRVASPLDLLIADRKFRLEVMIEDAYGIESVGVVQDGRALDAQWIGEHLVASGKTARLSCDLTLPEGANETTVKVRATNVRKIQSAPKTVFVRWQPPQRDLYVLALGVADYEDDRLDLAYPVKDADDLIARFAAEQGGYYKTVYTQRLANAEVTTGRLHKAREEFLLRAQPEDTIVVFAAGHGVRSESGEYYFLTPGTTPDDPYDGIERQVLESLVTWDRLQADRRVLLLDTCHSGEAFGEGKRGLATDAFDQKTVNDAAGTGLYIIAASSERGFAQEMHGNGLFTRCLIEGLDGAADKNRDGFVGIDELKTYATASVHERSGGRQRPTVPRIEGGEDFPLARRIEALPAPK